MRMRYKFTITYNVHILLNVTIKSLFYNLISIECKEQRAYLNSTLT
jgi:hypothetical protein